MSFITRALLDGLTPDGSAFRPAPGGALDLLYSGVADNWEAVRAAMQGLGAIRDPYATPVIMELEREFGIVTNTSMTLAQRQAVLAAAKFQRNQGGTAAALQAALDLAGFGAGGSGLKVFGNSGGADPRNYVNGIPYLQAGATTAGYAQAGGGHAFAGISGGGGTLVVNGYQYGVNVPAYFGAGMTGVSGYGYAGNNLAFSGYYTQLGLGYYAVTYPVPADSGYWPLFFFLAPSATGYPGTITAMTYAQIPALRQQELLALICRYKPIHTWAIIMANWI